MYPALTSQPLTSRFISTEFEGACCCCCFFINCAANPFLFSSLLRLPMLLETTTFTAPPPPPVIVSSTSMAVFRLTTVATFDRPPVSVCCCCSLAGAINCCNNCGEAVVNEFRTTVRPSLSHLIRFELCELCAAIDPPQSISCSPELLLLLWFALDKGRLWLSTSCDDDDDLWAEDEDSITTRRCFLLLWLLF